MYTFVKKSLTLVLIIVIWLLVACLTQSDCVFEDIRLVGGISELEGRVEVYINNEWGTICDDSWDNNDASVACRQLGFSSEGAFAVDGGTFGPGTGPIHLNNLDCNGQEIRLPTCLRKSNCGHDEDAGVICSGAIIRVDGLCKDIRLVGGASENEGRVEVYINNEWGTVCDDSWGNDDASVACRQLGYSAQGASAVFRATSTFGEGTGPIFLDDLHCSGQEDRLVDCPYFSCQHDEDAGVTCSKGVYLMLGSSTLSNNSIVSANEIFSIIDGNNVAQLSCITESPMCCLNEFGSGWEFPNGALIPIANTSDLLDNDLYVTREFQTLALNVPSGTYPPNGVYHCQVPDGRNVTTSLYIGIYNYSSGGNAHIDELIYDKDTQTISCISIGGPISTVSWKKDNLFIDGKDQRYDFSQQLLRSYNATYIISKLTIISKTEAASGVYTCKIENVKGMDTSSVFVSVCEQEALRINVQQTEANLSRQIPQVCDKDVWLDILSVDTLTVRSDRVHTFDIKLFLSSNSINITLGNFSSLDDGTSLEVLCSTKPSYDEEIQHIVRAQLSISQSEINVTIGGLNSNTQYNCCATITTMPCTTCLFASVTTKCDSVLTYMYEEQETFTSSVLIIALGTLAGIFLLITFSTWIILCIGRIACQQGNSNHRRHFQEKSMIRNPIYEQSDIDSSNCHSTKPPSKTTTVAEDHLYTDISLLPTSHNVYNNEDHLYTDIDKLPKRKSTKSTSEDEGVEASNPLYATGDTL